MAGVSGPAVASVLAGTVLVYAGVKGKSLPAAFQAIVQGKSPAGAAAANQITGSAPAKSGGGGGGGGLPPQGTPPDSATVAGYKSYAMGLMALYGWPGQFGTFSNIVMAESGWNPQAFNPSGAWGIAQALGHGTPATDAGNGHNEYGNYGTSDAVCKKANAGHGTSQILWMCNYIKQRYGSPNAAWAFHLANNSY